MKRVKDMKLEGMGEMHDRSVEGKSVPWWRNRYAVWLGWIPLIGCAALTAGVIIWTKNEVKLWEQTKAKWEAKGEIFDLASYYPEDLPRGEAAMDDPWLSELMNDRAYEASRSPNDPDLYTEIYGPIVGLPGEWHDWFYSEGDLADPSLGLVTKVRRDPEGEAQNNVEASELFLASIAQRVEQNQRLAELMERPAFVGSMGADSLDRFPVRLYKCSKILEIHGFKAIVHTNVGDASAAVDDLMHARQALRWLEDPKCLIDHTFLKHASVRFTEYVWECVVFSQFDEHQLTEIAALLETGLDWRKFAGDVVRGETAFRLAWLTRYADEPSQLGGYYGDWMEDLETTLLRVAVSTRGIIARNKRVIVDLHYTPLETWEQAKPRLPLKDFGQMLADAHNARYGIKEGPFVEYFAEQGGPYMVGYIACDRNERMDWNLAKSVVAVVRFRTMNDRDPKGWDELVPRFLDSIPDDPYSEEGLKFGRDSDGVLFVYSVGEDEIDDQGDVDADVRWLTEMKGVNEGDEK